MNEAALRARIGELEEEVRQLREALTPAERFPPELRLTPTCDRILATLLSRSPSYIARETLVYALSAPSHPAVAVMIWKLRQQLRFIGVSIESQRTHGYRLDAANAAKLRQKMAELAP
jgi:DNA-binding response OmpR family regulator